METEIKLGPLTREQQNRIFEDTVRLPALSPAETIRMETVYYDDPEGFFSARRYTLRLRRENGRCVAAFKSAPRGLSRLELECEAPDMAAGAQKLAAMPDLPEDAREALARRTLVPVCGARFTRRCRLCRGEGAVLEVCADLGVLYKGDVRQELCEIELELKQGEPAALQALARTLKDACGAEVCPRSKQQRAMALGGERA